MQLTCIYNSIYRHAHMIEPIKVGSDITVGFRWYSGRVKCLKFSFKTPNTPEALKPKNS